jgi:hypothetical protein
MVLEVLHYLRGFEEERLDGKTMILNVDNLSKVSFNNHAIIMLFSVNIHRNATGILIHLHMSPHHVQFKVTLHQLNWVNDIPEALVNVIKNGGKYFDEFDVGEFLLLSD